MVLNSNNQTILTAYANMLASGGTVSVGRINTKVVQKLIDWANSQLDIETAVSSLVIAMQNSPAGTQVGEIISAADLFFPILSAPAVVATSQAVEVENVETAKATKAK